MADMFGSGLGEIALDPSDLKMSDKEVGKGLVEKMIVKGQEYLSELAKSLKDYFLGPIKGADRMAYFEMLKRCAMMADKDTDLELIRAATTAKIMLLTHNQPKKLTAFDRVSQEKGGVENDSE